jgi:hypothetical protein
VPAPAVAVYDVVLAIHVMAVVVAFGWTCVLFSGPVAGVYTPYIRVLPAALLAHTTPALR